MGTNFVNVVEELGKDTFVWSKRTITQANVGKFGNKDCGYAPRSLDRWNDLSRNRMETTILINIGMKFLVGSQSIDSD